MYIKSDYLDKVNKINDILQDIEKLKMIHAIQKRLHKAEQIALILDKYEDVYLYFISKRHSLILKSIADYRTQFNSK